MIIREGETYPIRFTVELDSQPADLTNVTLVELVARSGKNPLKSLVYKTTDSPPRLFITDAVNGILTLNPQASDFRFIENRYMIVIWVDFPIGRAAFPSGSEILLEVRERFE